MFNNQLLYKEIKNYKNVENHWISGKVEDISNIILDNKYFSFKFINKNIINNSFRISHKLINYDLLFQRDLISYDYESKKIIYNDIINFWYTDSNKINLGNPLQHIYLNKNFVKYKYISNKNLFLNIEQKKYWTLLKNSNTLEYFNYLNIFKKIYKFDYSKNILKILLIKFIQKQSLLLYKKKNKKKNNIYIKSIILGFRHKDLILYSPTFLKIFFIPKKLFLKSIKKIFRKHFKKNLKKKKNFLKTKGKFNYKSIGLLCWFCTRWNIFFKIQKEFLF